MLFVNMKFYSKVEGSLMALGIFELKVHFNHIQHLSMHLKQSIGPTMGILVWFWGDSEYFWSVFHGPHFSASYMSC